MSSYLENLPSITGNLGESVTILREFVLKTEEIEGGTRLIITSLRTGEVQVVDIMDGHTPVRGVDYWTENDQAEMTKAAEDAALAAFKVDETLSQEGMPADAGAVGEAVSKLSASVEEKQPSGDYVLRSEIPAVPQNVLQYTEQTLSEEQKTQSRANIDAVAAGVVEELSQTVDAQGKAIDEKQPSGDYALRSELPVVPQNVLQYIEQTLTEEQKTQSRANIGAAAAGVVEELSQTVDAHGKAIDGKQPSGDYALRSELPVVPQNVLQYTEQMLTEEQKTQSRANIGAAAVGTVDELVQTVDTHGQAIDGKQPLGDYALKSELPEVPVESVNGKTGAVNLDAKDVGAMCWKAGVVTADDGAGVLGWGMDSAYAPLAYVTPNGQVRSLVKHVYLNGANILPREDGAIEIGNVYTPNNLQFDISLQKVDKVLGVRQSQYELIEKIPIGYEFLIDQPDDWDDEWQNYYRLDGFWRIKPIGDELTAKPTWNSNTFLRYTGEIVNRIERTQEPDGTPYCFSDAIMFGHMTPDINAAGLLDSGFFSETNVKIAGGLITIPKGTEIQTYQRHVSLHIRRMPNGIYDSYATDAQQGSPATVTKAASSNHGASISSFATHGAIVRFVAFIYPSSTLNFVEGSYFEIWGIRA